MWKPMKMAALLLGITASSLLWAKSWMDELTLPLPQQLPYCGSQELQMLIAADGTAIDGSATVTINRDGLNVVVRDHQNLQLATLHHSPAGEITVSDSSLLKPSLTRLVLTAIYLHRLDPRQWAATQPGWSWQSGDGETQLLYQGESQIKLGYGKPSEPGAATQFSMAASGFALTTKVLGATPGGN